MNNGSGISNNSSIDQSMWRRIIGWPFTQLGRWSVGLLAGFVLFFFLFQILVASGQRGGETFFSNPWLGMSMMIASISAFAGGVTALVAILRKRERSILVFIALIWGFFVTLFVLLEILFPH